MIYIYTYIHIYYFIIDMLYIFITVAPLLMLVYLGISLGIDEEIYNITTYSNSSATHVLDVMGAVRAFRWVRIIQEFLVSFILINVQFYILTRIFLYIYVYDFLKLSSSVDFFIK